MFSTRTDADVREGQRDYYRAEIKMNWERRKESGKLKKGLKMAEAHLKHCQSCDCQTLGVLQIYFIWYHFFIHSNCSVNNFFPSFENILILFDIILIRVHTFHSCIPWSHSIIFSNVFCLCCRRTKALQKPPRFNLANYIYIYYSNIVTIFLYLLNHYLKIENIHLNC